MEISTASFLIGSWLFHPLKIKYSTGRRIYLQYNLKSLLNN